MPFPEPPQDDSDIRITLSKAELDAMTPEEFRSAALNFGRGLPNTSEKYLVEMIDEMIDDLIALGLLKSSENTSIQRPLRPSRFFAGSHPEGLLIVRNYIIPLADFEL